MHGWVNALLGNLRDLQGMNRNAISRRARRLLAESEEMFRNGEFDERKKAAAVEKCRALIRDRVVEEIAKDDIMASAHWRIVLDVIDSPARPPKA